MKTIKEKADLSARTHTRNLICYGKEELNEDESFVNTFSSFLSEAISTMEE